MKKIISALPAALFVAACSGDKNTDQPFNGTRLNASWLDHIISNSDSTVTKPYFRTDFVTASYYYNSKDSSLCQVMRDSSKKVRQVIITKNDIRTFFSRYYPNGQAELILGMNKEGKYEGEAVNYYPDGKVLSKGSYHNGFFSGTWEYFDDKGKKIREEEFDSNGQRVRTENF